MPIRRSHNKHFLKFLVTPDRSSTMAADDRPRSSKLIQFLELLFWSRIHFPAAKQPRPQSNSNLSYSLGASPSWGGGGIYFIVPPKSYSKVDKFSYDFYREVLSLILEEDEKLQQNSKI